MLPCVCLSLVGMGPTLVVFSVFFSLSLLSMSSRFLSSLPLLSVPLPLFMPVCQCVCLSFCLCASSLLVSDRPIVGWRLSRGLFLPFSLSFVYVFSVSVFFVSVDCLTQCSFVCVRLSSYLSLRLLVLGWMGSSLCVLCSRIHKAKQKNSHTS